MLVYVSRTPDITPVNWHNLWLFISKCRPEGDNGAWQLRLSLWYHLIIGLYWKNGGRTNM